MTKWINAKEVLPEEGERVLAYTEHSMYGKEHYLKRDITIAEYRDGNWKCANFLGNNVLAWAKLPDPPTKEVVL